MTFYDALETRSADARAASLAECLPALLTHAQSLAGYGNIIRRDTTHTKIIEFGAIFTGVL